LNKKFLLLSDLIIQKRKRNRKRNSFLVGECICFLLLKEEKNERLNSSVFVHILKENVEDLFTTTHVIKTFNLLCYSKEEILIRYFVHIIYSRLKYKRKFQYVLRLSSSWLTRGEILFFQSAMSDYNHYVRSFTYYFTILNNQTQLNWLVCMNIQAVNCDYCWTE
jgi:hypothetical protein